MTTTAQDTGSDANRSLVTTLLASRNDPKAAAARLANASARADECEPWLKAFTYRPDLQHVDVASLADLPLAGIPVAIKDLMDTADMPTTYGSPIHAGYRPAADAWITAQIRAYGGVVFGKTVTTEFAWREPGPTVNPWNPLHTPGGSSSGSAAAVGAGIVPLATGTQTVGSVIRPAAFCGVVGYKPSYGKIPTTGVHPLSHSLDHIGFFAKKVEDTALAHALFIDAQPQAIASSQNWRLISRVA
jgi:amidase